LADVLFSIRHLFHRSPHRNPSSNGGPFFDYRSFENTTYDGQTITEEQIGGTDSPETMAVGNNNNRAAGSRPSDSLRMNELT
jgi:hypothetical protein